MKSIKLNLRVAAWILTLLSASSYADLTDNLRASLDASVRLNKNNADYSTSRIYALGVDAHKILTTADGDVGYVMGQLYFTKLSNQTPYSFLFDSPDDQQFIVREAHVNYTGGTDFVPNIRLGHFTLPFGLEESIDTNGRLLDYYHGKNLGSKLDWGLSLNKVLTHFQYNVSYTMGGKNKPKRIDGSYVYSGRVGTIDHKDFKVGVSLLSAKIDGIKRKRYAIDLQYFWRTWGVLGEIAYGNDDRLIHSIMHEKYRLFELNKTSIDGQLKIYSQYIITNREGVKNSQELFNIGLSYQINRALELSISGRKQLDSPTIGNKKNLLRIQLRYRY